MIRAADCVWQQTAGRSLIENRKTPNFAIPSMKIWSRPRRWSALLGLVGVALGTCASAWADAIPAATVSQVLGIPGVAYQLPAKQRYASRGVSEHEYLTADGKDVVLNLLLAPAGEYAGWKGAMPSEPVSGVGTDAFFEKKFGLLCSRSVTRAACVSPGPLYYMGKNRPSMDQMKTLLRAAL